MDEIKDYIELIDEQYKKAKKKRLSRLSVEWGKWSTQMNREIRTKIKAGHPDKERLIYVQNYWQTKSQLLELHHISRLGKQTAKIRLARECKKVLKIIFPN